MRRLTPIVLCFAATVLSADTASLRDPSNLVVHEWGTFTSVAGPGGEAVEWWTLGGVQDLPCFVPRFNVGKCGIRGTVRMETPVIYFYAPHPVTVDVEVQFKQGIISEWFPHAELTPTVMTRSFERSDFRHKLVWSDVEISPRASEEYPRESGSSHYYAARETDAAPIEVAGQKEKFLFYRGIGRFSIPLLATVDGNGQVVLRNTGSEPLATAIVFENRAGRIGYRVQNGVNGKVVWDPPALNGDLFTLTAKLEQVLIAQGLYPKEARAMIETWRDTWFEHGTRIFYVVPAKMIDGVLPLRIDPRPSRIARVFVGRVELITAAAQQEVAEAIAQNNPGAAAKYGRLLPSVLERLYPADGPDRQRAYRILEPAYASLLGGSRTCGTPGFGVAR